MIKEEDRLNSTVLYEGIVSVRALIDAAEKNISDRRITKVLFDKSRLMQKDKEYRWLCHRGEALGFTVELVPAETIQKLAVGNSHGGIAAYATERTLPGLDQCDFPHDGFYVMLEGIEDPYNFGYAVRSLYAAGVFGIILTPRNWMSASGIVCRSSAGASERIPIYVSENGTDAADRFHQHGYSVICADLRDSVPVYTTCCKYPLLLIVGGEKRGISRSLLDRADQRVSISYGRDFQESLSAASAASVLAFEIYRQNHYE